MAVLNFSRGLATMAEGIVTAGVQLRPVCFVMIDFPKSRKGLFLFNGGKTEWTLSRAAAHKDASNSLWLICHCRGQTITLINYLKHSLERGACACVCVLTDVYLNI